MKNDDTLINVLNLKTYFFTSEGVVKAVDGVDLEIRKGETVGLAGESGCGKSTLAYSITRLIPRPGRIIDGKIIFRGENLLEKSEREMRSIRGRKISMIFQEPTASLNPVFTAGDQIMEVIRLHQKVRRKEAWERMIEMLRLVRIPDPERVAKEYPFELSGGMQQRVMIAMALACRPELLIADEPTTSLDVTTQAQILELMRELKREINTSILYISHNLAVISQLCNMIGIMYAGDLVEFSDVATFFHKPMHPYTQKLLDAIPKVKQKTKRLEAISGFVPSLIDPPTGCKFHPRCHLAKESCSQEKPPLALVDEGHWVRCWRYGKK